MERPIRGRGKNKRFWTPQEDETLLQSLLELSHNPKWKSENGFKSGYMNLLESMISAKLPNVGLKAEPHIESRLKHWSDKYCAMAEMLGIYGFSWNDEKKLLQVERSVYEEWILTHKKAKGLYGVPFPFYDMLAEIYGKDRATGQASESFMQAVQNIEMDLTRGSTTHDSDEDFDFEAETENESMQSGSSSRKRKDSSSSKSVERHKIQVNRMENIGDLASSLQSVTLEFGKVFQDMNSSLREMAQSWSSEEGRKKKLDDDTNKVFEEVLKLDSLSPSDALEVASILMAEEHKLQLFYQAPTQFKKQYIVDLLRKK